DVESGDLEQFSPGSVFLSDFATLDLPFGVGDTATFLLEDMTQLELHVAGEFTNSLGTADMLIAHEDILPHLREPLISLVLVNVADGIDPDSVAADIERLGESGYPLQVLTHEQYIAGVD